MPPSVSDIGQVSAFGGHFGVAVVFIQSNFIAGERVQNW